VGATDGKVSTGAARDRNIGHVRFVAFAALDTLRALPRLAEFAFRSFARCTFDVLRLAIIVPLVRHDTTVQVAASYQTQYQQIATLSAPPTGLFFHGRTGVGRPCRGVGRR
jgi:hypothetical protein